MVSKMVKIWLRAEGLAVLIVSLFLYQKVGKGWLLFGLLFLTPDVSMFGYLAGSRLGAVAYNLFHNYVMPITLGLFGLWIGNNTVVAVALIWIAHIGFDRSLGYGLKYPSGFKDTHLRRIGA